MATMSVFYFLASYAIAFGLECFRLIRRTTLNRSIMLLVALAGLIAHTFYLFEQSWRAGLPPLLSSTHDWLLVLAWLAIVLYLFLTTLDRDLALGLFLLPIVLILITSSYFVSEASNPVMGPAAEVNQEAVRSWAMVHASLIVFGIGFVLIGFVISMMFLVQHRRLKQKQTMQNGLTLPSLEKLARMNWWAVITSVPLLLLGSITGIGLGLFAAPDAVATSFTDPVIIGNGAVWIAMLIFFGWLCLTKRPAAKQVAWLTIWAFGLLLATLIGLQVLTGGHFSASKSTAATSSDYGEIA